MCSDAFVFAHVCMVQDLCIIQLPAVKALSITSLIESYPGPRTRGNKLKLLRFIVVFKSLRYY